MEIYYIKNLKINKINLFFPIFHGKQFGFHCIHYCMNYTNYISIVLRYISLEIIILYFFLKFIRKPLNRMVVCSCILAKGEGLNFIVTIQVTLPVTTMLKVFSVFKQMNHRKCPVSPKISMMTCLQFPVGYHVA